MESAGNEDNEKEDENGECTSEEASEETTLASGCERNGTLWEMEDCGMYEEREWDRGDGSEEIKMASDCEINGTCMEAEGEVERDKTGEEEENGIKRTNDYKGNETCRETVINKGGGERDWAGEEEETMKHVSGCEMIGSRMEMEMREWRRERKKRIQRSNGGSIGHSLNVHYLK